MGGDPEGAPGSRREPVDPPADASVAQRRAAAPEQPQAARQSLADPEAECGTRATIAHGDRDRQHCARGRGRAGTFTARLTVVSASSMRILARSSLLSVRVSACAAVTLPESVGVPGRTGVSLTTAVRLSPGASVPSAQPAGGCGPQPVWLTRAVVPRALPPATPDTSTFRRGRLAHVGDLDRPPGRIADAVRPGGRDHSQREIRSAEPAAGAAGDGPIVTAASLASSVGSGSAARAVMVPRLVRVWPAAAGAAPPRISKAQLLAGGELVDSAHDCLAVDRAARSRGPG